MFQLDLPLSVLFYKWLLGKESTLCITDLHYVDSDLFFSISKLQQLLREKRRIETDAKLVSGRLASYGNPVQNSNYEFCVILLRQASPIL